MTLQEIKTAVDNGQEVMWKNPGYRVKKWRNDEYVIVWTADNNAIGLTWRDKVTMNGAEEDFSILI